MIAELENEVLPAAAPMEHAEVELTADDVLGIKLLNLDTEMRVDREAMKAKRDAYIALLPIASDEQYAEVVRCAKAEEATPECYRVNVDFKLSDAQKLDLADVRKARKEHLAANKAEYVTPLLTDKAQRLTSLKVRVGTKKTTTTARFERTMGGVVQKGLIASLRARLAK